MKANHNTKILCRIHNQNTKDFCKQKRNIIYCQPHILQEKSCIKKKKKKEYYFKSPSPFVFLSNNSFYFIITNLFWKTINQLTQTNQRNRTPTTPTNSSGQNITALYRWLNEQHSEISCYCATAEQVLRLISSTDMLPRKISKSATSLKNIFKSFFIFFPE